MVALPAAVLTALGNMMEPGVEGGRAEGVKEYTGPPREAEKEKEVVVGSTAFTEVRGVTT